MIIAFAQTKTARLQKIFADQKEVPWLYLGSDYFSRTNFDNGLGSTFTRIDIANLLNAVAEEIRKEHVQWIDKLNERYGHDLDWWFSSISSRNNYDSNLYQFCCYLEVLERLSKQNPPKLIILESKGLAKAIEKWATENNLSVKVIGSFKARKAFFSRRLTFFLRWFKSIYIFTLRFLAGKISRINNKAKSKVSGSPIIISTYLHDGDLNKDGYFSDRYFPFLYEYLNKKEKKVVVYPVLYGFKNNYIGIFKRLRASKVHFLIQEDLLRTRDYIASYTYPFRLLKKKIEADAFRNFDLSEVLKEEQKTQPISSSILALLNYRFFLRLGKSGLKPSQFITWYENQVNDKGMIAGVRKAFPKVKIIGAQIFLHPNNHLNLYPSKSETKAGLIPDLLLETSDYQCKVARSFDGSIACKPTAALRYKHIFENEAGKGDSKQSGQSILVLLPFNIYESVELLERFSSIISKIDQNIQILIKSHPDYQPADLINALGGNWPARFEIFENDLAHGLEMASMVVSSSSSSMVEAAAKGIPSIFLGRQTVLSQNTLANVKMDIVTQCFTSQELLNAINKYLGASNSKSEFQKMGQKLRDTFFTPITDKTLEPFLLN